MPWGNRPKLTLEQHIERFWARVTSQPEEGCWPWPGSRDKDGYGYFKTAGKTVKAHRFAAKVSLADYCDELFVCHTCDNPSCVRPSHLFMGSGYDNAADRDAKGRGARQKGYRVPYERLAKGERVNTSRLTAAQVVEIRALRASGLTLQAIGDRYGVAKQSVRAICLGRHWKHIPLDS